MSYLSALFGALLTCVGAVVGAYVTRMCVTMKINAQQRSVTAPAQAARAKKAVQPYMTGATGKLRADVIAALVTAGYSKAESIEAVDACEATQRATIENWMRCALKNAMKAAA